MWRVPPPSSPSQAPAVTKEISLRNSNRLAALRRSVDGANERDGLAAFPSIKGGWTVFAQRVDQVLHLPLVADEADRVGGAGARAEYGLIFGREDLVVAGLGLLEFPTGDLVVLESD